MTRADDVLPRRFHSAVIRGARWFAQRVLLKPTVATLTRLRVEGRGNLDGLTRPFIVVANHSSHLDAPLVLSALPWRHVKHLATGAAADYFFDVRWRTWLTEWFFNAYPVERTTVGKHPHLSKALLGAGMPLLIFPEGGRAKNGQKMRTFKPGAAALAAKFDLPIVPIGLVDAQRAMPRGRNMPVRGRVPVTVKIGTPMRTAQGERPEGFSRRLEAAVAELSGQPCPEPPTRSAREQHDRPQPVPTAPTSPAAPAARPAVETQRIA